MITKIRGGYSCWVYSYGNFICHPVRNKERGGEERERMAERRRNDVAR
jgi:hypothetical protein